MKKLFALLMVAGTLAMYSCGGKHEESTNTDSTAAAEGTTMETATVDSAAATVDSAAAAPAPAPADSAAHNTTAPH
jgi:hypothetical protein